MSTITHERPGVYSSYDTSTVVSAGVSTKTVGLAAKAASGQTGQPLRITSYTACTETFGENCLMSELTRLLFLNGAASVVCVRIPDDASSTDYEEFFRILDPIEDIRVVVCDTNDPDAIQSMLAAVSSASKNRRERIAVAGCAGKTVQNDISNANSCNNERMVLVAPEAQTVNGGTFSTIYAAAALAGAIAGSTDPAAPLNGVPLYGLTGLQSSYNDNDIDLLVRGGVTPLEAVGGTISPVRCVTSHSKTGGVSDATWRELSTILVVDDVIPSLRNVLRSRFIRAKNTEQSRSAIRSQVIVELEKKRAAQMIDSYGEVSVSAMEDNPSVCLVEFSFTVAHGLNQIYLSAHITI